MVRVCLGLRRCPGHRTSGTKTTKSHAGTRDDILESNPGSITYQLQDPVFNLRKANNNTLVPTGFGNQYANTYKALRTIQDHSIYTGYIRVQNYYYWLTNSKLLQWCLTRTSPTRAEKMLLWLFFLSIYKPFQNTAFYKTYHSTAFVPKQYLETERTNLCR